MDISTALTTALARIVSVEEQREALADIYGDVPDLRTVFTRFPDAIQPAHLPAVLLVPGEARNISESHQHMQLLRTWTARIYVANWPSNSSGRMEELAEPWLDTLPLALAAYPVVHLSDGRAFNVQAVRTSGVVPLTYLAPQQYAGVVQTFQTETMLFVPRVAR